MRYGAQYLLNKQKEYLKKAVDSDTKIRRAYQEKCKVGYAQCKQDMLAIFSDLSRPSSIRLMAGELTAAEMRTVQAVLRGFAEKLRSLNPTLSKTERVAEPSCKESLQDRA